MKEAILLFGGRSEERLVSVASAQNLAKHYPFSELWFFAESGKAFRVNSRELIEHREPFKQKFQPREKSFAESFERSLAHVSGRKVFLGFHGTEGEDGHFQSLLEKQQIIFTGSGSEASRLCFHKKLAKERVSKFGIEVVSDLSFSTVSVSTVMEPLEAMLDEWKKIVLKPVANGSSIGLFVVSDGEGLERSLVALSRGSELTYIAEPFVEGRELTVGVIQRKTGVMALPASEVVLDRGASFDYEGKYLGRGTKEITPAALTGKEMARAQEVALRSHEVLGCFGYSRTDLILKGDGGIVYLETNTLPGVTSASFIPQQLQAAGIPMGEFISEQLEWAEGRDG